MQLLCILERMQVPGCPWTPDHEHPVGTSATAQAIALGIISLGGAVYFWKEYGTQGGFLFDDDASLGLNSACGSIPLWYLCHPGCGATRGACRSQYRVRWGSLHGES